MTINEFKISQLKEFGHGGIKCPCCFEGKKNKNRKTLNRRARARVKETTRKEIKEAIAS